MFLFSHKGTKAHRFMQHRHPELVSPCGDCVPGSISQNSSAFVARWMLKQVQHDEFCV
jgi:hypothetical protein